jgi:hypothetical protein
VIRDECVLETDELGEAERQGGSKVGRGIWAEQTSFRLTTTGASTAIEASPFAVVGCAGLDGDDFAVCLCGCGLGYTTSVAIAGKRDGQECREEEFDTGNHDEIEDGNRTRRESGCWMRNAFALRTARDCFICLLARSF